MVLVRDIFRLKFGHSKEAMVLWREAASVLRSSNYGAMNVRLLSDLVGGVYYTVVLESTYHSAAEWEKAHIAARDNVRWRELYAQIIPLTEEGRREMFCVVS